MVESLPIQRAHPVSFGSAHLPQSLRHCDTVHHCSPCRQAVLECVIVVQPDGNQPSQDALVSRQVGVVPGLREAVQAQAIHPDLVVVTQAYHLQDVVILGPREGILPHDAVDNLTSISGVIKISR